MRPDFCFIKLISHTGNIVSGIGNGNLHKRTSVMGVLFCCHLVEVVYGVGICPGTISGMSSVNSLGSLAFLKPRLFTISFV